MLSNPRSVRLLAAALYLLTAATAGAQDADAPLQVGVKSSPPFALKQADGDWTGVSIDLWRTVAEELDLEYEFQELPLDALLDGLADGELDAAVAAISVTAERNERVDFCHPHFTTGLGIATRVGHHGSVWALVRRIVSLRLLTIVGVMIVVVALCGLLFWRFEREVNQTMFGGKRRQGIGMGLWWSTILLMGHKGVVPVSTAGRLVAGSAMVASLLLLSVLTGVITSVITVHQLDLGIDDPTDLRHARVVTVERSTAADFLRSRRIAFRSVGSAGEALAEVVDDRADAVVYDRPLLQHLVRQEHPTAAQVLTVSFQTQDYAIALAQGSPLRKRINTEILKVRASDAWRDTLFRYLGE